MTAIRALQLADRMIDGMLEEAKGEPLDVAAEAAVRCAIAFVKGCAIKTERTPSDALVFAATMFVEAAKVHRS